MQRNRPAGVLLILAAVLLVAFATAAAAYSGRVVTSHTAAGTRASAHLDAPALTRRMEDEVAPEMPWAASLAGADDGGIGLDPNMQACLKTGCPARGNSFTYHRGCQPIYGCPPQ
ncbi:hypothetical protein ACQ4PT_047051 [Festuca glaucescens]